MSARTVASLVAMSASLIVGCVPPRTLARGVVTAAVIEIVHSAPRVVVVHEEAPTVFVVAPDPPTAPGVDGAPPRGFDPVEGRAAADAVDLSSCWPGGSMRGYSSARVTFDPSGSVDLVEVVSKENEPAPDPACVAHKYETVKVPAFRGPAVTVRTTFYVS